ncbi:MAG: hypothetical protein KME29_19375 [Calothrix sp. FI2-JRJ7]|jgi:hypothetical protein|nr:hypothetical protein [Calothrix sp. FI2-JRJ7]
MTINLSNHPIWQEFTEILNKIDLNALVVNHLKACNYKVIGYQDKNDFYEEIEFITPIEAEFISGSLNVTSEKKDESGWITINFMLKAATLTQDGKSLHHQDEIDEIAELTLIFDSNMKCIDENWLIYIESPFIVTKAKNCMQELSPA